MLLANYPNPFNPETWIPYQLARDSHVQITIYDVQGAIIRRLELGYRVEGFYTTRGKAAHWDGRNEVGERVASGIYFYQLETDDVISPAEDGYLEIVSNDLMIAGMLMFISFPVIADEWVELGSLASSSRNDALSDKRV